MECILWECSIGEHATWDMVPYGGGLGRQEQLSSRGPVDLLPGHRSPSLMASFSLELTGAPIPRVQPRQARSLGLCFRMLASQAGKEL